MIWVYLHGQDGRPLLVCPAVDAELWYLLDGSRWWRYELVCDPAEEAPPCPS